MFSFIAAEKANYPVAVMGRVLGVNRTSFHDWERRPPSDPLREYRQRCGARSRPSWSISEGDVALAS